MKWEVTKQVLAQIIRYMLSALGAFLVTKGIVDPDLADRFLNEMTSYIVGIIIIGIVALWGFLKTKYDILAIFTALNTKPNPEVQPHEALQEIKQEVKANYTVPSM